MTTLLPHESAELTLADFDFPLPPELIAQTPTAQRTGSRLLEVRADGCVDRRFPDIATLLRPGDLLVMNDTRVIKARLLGEKAATGGRLEALVERIVSAHEALAMVRASKSPGAGTPIRFDAPGGDAPATARVVDREGTFWRLAFDEPVLDVLDRCGSVPLPPYIEHAAGDDDARRYQTVYAREPGSVAAPTAGLHFDEPLLEALRAAGVDLAWVTLHVGAGTFQPVRSERIAEHTMHAERYTVGEAAAAQVRAARARGGRVVAVGTTSMRTLESVARDDGTILAATGETALFITPGFRFRVVDALVTNFHLPRSTLLMLVSAFAGRERILAAYAHAVRERYRFFSYGDAMWLPRLPGDAASAPPRD